LTLNAYYDDAEGHQAGVISIAELEADPHNVLGYHRGRTPFLQREDGIILILRAKDVQALFSDPRTRQAETELVEIRGITTGALFDLCKHTMLLSNGAKHRARRSPLSRTFAFRMISQLRPRIRSFAEEIIDAHDDKGEMDLLSEYASLIPAHTIASILGLPHSDVAKFTSLVYIVSKLFGSSMKPEDVPEMESAAVELTAYVRDLIEDRRRHPQDDFLTDYIAAVEEAGDLSPLEAISQIVSVVLAGSDTTRAAMVIQAALLLQHPEQWRAVCDDQKLVPQAVLEAMRFEPSVASLPRFTREDIEIGGRNLPANSIISLMTISAMRDEQLYSDPDRFDIRREHPRWHLVFGGGEHRCLGEALAKVELEEGLAALATRLPNLRVVGEAPRIEGHAGIRRVSPMHVAW
jgi:cytochrome P450